MGRAFEFRKERKFKRWGHMAKTFTKIGKEITIAVKQGGPDVTGNPRLRALMAEARSENMPKDNVERAIKKALEKDQGDFKEIVYEGYGPHGIAFLVETATDNNTRTVANVRSYFTKCGGTLGTSGSVSFMFDHKCVFRIKDKEGLDIEELQLELCDCDDDPEVFTEERATIGVNPNTVMRTYEKLTLEGVIYNKRGIGYFISPDSREIVLESSRKEFIENELPAVLKKIELLGLDPEKLLKPNKE